MREFTQKAQSTLEYLLVVTSVVSVLIAFTSPAGPFQNSLDSGVNAGIGALQAVGERIEATARRADPVGNGNGESLTDDSGGMKEMVQPSDFQPPEKGGGNDTVSEKQPKAPIEPPPDAPEKRPADDPVVQPM